jgi:DNA repair protein RecN (Recombination protein N)
VLGGRAERTLVRAGAEQGTVTASFRPPDDHAVWSMLAEQSIGADGELIVRRTLSSDGRSRAFVNDEPVTGQLLRRLGDTLVEVHGQHDQKGLLNQSVHRDLLDAFGGLGTLAAAVREVHAAWREVAEDLARLEQEVAETRREEEYLRHRAAELADLAARPGEEDELADQRQRLMNREKLLSALEEAMGAVAGSGGARERLSSAERKLERIRDLAPEWISPALDALGRSLIELTEAEGALEAVARDLDLDAGQLERIETRLFALRDMARKHRMRPDDLPQLLAETETALARIDSGGEAVDEARGRVTAERAAYLERSAELSKRRTEVAKLLARAVTAELAPLKLERARFRVAIEPLAEEDWGANGRERIAFEVSTNPGQPFGPLARIASGGELSRFMLALKVVLARLDSTETLIFDEVDAGIGGATADAVGERLARLADERQVLVVTHAPQVAACAHHHLTVSKLVHGDQTSVAVRVLQAEERRHEVARMLAGAEVTEAARVAADSLLERGQR